MLQSIPPLCLTYSIIKGQLLSYHAYMVWEVKDPLSQKKCRLGLSVDQLSANGENKTIQTYLQKKKENTRKPEAHTVMGLDYANPCWVTSTGK